MSNVHRNHSHLPLAAARPNIPHQAISFFCPGDQRNQEAARASVRAYSRCTKRTHRSLSVSQSSSRSLAGAVAGAAGAIGGAERGIRVPSLVRTCPKRLVRLCPVSVSLNVYLTVSPAVSLSLSRSLSLPPPLSPPLSPSAIPPSLATPAPQATAHEIRATSRRPASTRGHVRICSAERVLSPGDFSSGCPISI